MRLICHSTEKRKPNKSYNMVTMDFSAWEWREDNYKLIHKMRSVRRAVIDVGTNSVKLLVDDVHGAVVEPRVEKSEQTRLGRGFYETHLLQLDAIIHTAQTVRKFARRAEQEGAES